MSTRRLRLALASVALAGVALTGYLTLTSLVDAQTLCPTSGCEVVLASRYSELFGVPISALGLVAFLALVGSAAHPSGAFPGAAVALAGVLYAAYLVAVQLLVIEALCTLCLTSHALMGTAAALAVARLLAAPETGIPPSV